MSNNKLDGYLGHLAIAGQLEEVNHHLARIATALERPNEIERWVGTVPEHIQEALFPTAQEPETNDAAEEVAQLEPTQTREPF
jgi:hypothetical protein